MNVIETDFEPDDAIAICAYASQSNNIELVVFVDLKIKLR